MTYRPPEDIRAMLAALAKEDDRTLTQEINSLIRAEYRKRHDNHPPEQIDPNAG